MAIAVLMEIPGLSPEQSAAVAREMGVSGVAPGELIHIEGPMEGGLRAVDVWESQAAYDNFIATVAMPAMQRLGISLPADLKTTIWQVTTLFK